MKFSYFQNVFLREPYNLKFLSYSTTKSSDLTLTLPVLGRDISHLKKAPTVALESHFGEGGISCAAMP